MSNFVWKMRVMARSKAIQSLKLQTYLANIGLEGAEDCRYIFSPTAGCKPFESWFISSKLS